MKLIEDKNSRAARLRRVGTVLLIAMGGLLLGAVLTGTLNALIGGGEWSFGWTGYTYDDKGYTVGSGTVYSEDVTSIEVDWIDGNVEILPCEDFYISLTESSELSLTEKSLLRWRVDENGVLSVKYRAPSSFFGSSENKHKDLILRVPKRMLAQLKELKVTAASSNVFVGEIPFDGIIIKTASGNVDLHLSNAVKMLAVETGSGNTVLHLSEQPSLRLFWVSEKNVAPRIKLEAEERDGAYVFGGGLNEARVKSNRGGMTVQRDD